MLFFIVALIILLLSYVYVGWRIIVPADLASSWNIVAWIVLILFILIPLISFLLRGYGHSRWWSNLFTWVTYISMGFFSLVFVFILTRDISLFFSDGIKKIITFFKVSSVVDSVKTELSGVNRRQFITHSLNMGILGITAVLTGYGIFEARRRAAIKEVRIPIANLPQDFEGFRIVQITDIHAGLTIKKDFVKTIVSQVNKLSPDLIVLTGDLIDGSVKELQDHVSPLKELKANYGSYFVTGNHEYYFNVDPWIEEIKRLGFRVLINENSVLKNGEGRLIIAGVTDYEGGRFKKNHISDPKSAIQDAPADGVKILLAHQPRSIFEAADAGYDLQISGHTHGGQYFPWNFLVKLQQPFVAGLHKYGDTWIYISRGTGYWGPPIRLWARSEIALIELTSNSEV